MTEHTHGGRGRGLTLAASAALLLIGAVALVWALLSQQGDPPAPDASAGLSSAEQAPSSSAPDPQSGTVEDADAAETTAAPEPREDTSASTQAAPSPTAEPEPASPEPEEPAAPEVEALAPAEPVAVRLPGIDVASKLHPLGLNEDGTLEVPSGELYDQAAWYEGSPTPGEVGPSVIEGHVTSQGSIPSVFFDLGAVTPGDLIEVDREDGSTVTFEVYATDSFPKDDFPKVAVYGNTEVPELRVITCGGEYDPEARAHVDNIVVFARMVPTA